MTDPNEVDRLLHYVPMLVRHDSVTDWEREFCISIMARMNSGAFVPSPKQTPILQRIVAKFQAATMTGLEEFDNATWNDPADGDDEDDDFDLVERPL